MRESWRGDLSAALAVTLMAVPQGVAYAVMAGLPPAAGLYAAAWPSIVGSLARSSPYVSTGPTNALSLLVGSAVVGAASGASPMQTAGLLAIMVGVFQIAAGALRLGALVDYISRAVVLGYITGAGTLIALGQLGAATGTSMGAGDPLQRLFAWLDGLGATDPRALGLALLSTGAILGLRVWRADFPAAGVVMAASIVVSWAVDFPSLGLAVAGDVAAVPFGLPPLTLPLLEWRAMRDLVPVAIALTVLSLVESTSVARTLAAERGDRLDMAREFAGQGLANAVAGVTGGYPVSGSLSRSVLNVRAGATTRFAGVLAGVFTLVVLLALGPIVDYTPTASLAGLLFVIAWDLVDRGAIARVMGALWGDRLAFLGTLAGTWLFELDDAIYVGVAISIVLFLRRSRNLGVSELVVADGQLREAKPEEVAPAAHCASVRVIHVEGNLFFGAASELQEALDDATRDRSVKVLVVRLKRAYGMDYTCAGILMAVHERLAREGRHVVLVGMRPKTMALFERVGLTSVFAPEEIYPTEEGWFGAMERAVGHALDLVPADHEPDCPLAAWRRSRSTATPADAGV